MNQSDSEPDRSLLVLYATETGNAEDAANYIARQCRRISCQCRVVSIDRYSLPDLISENAAIFVVSTTGSGVEPRSMTPLWNILLRSDLPHDLFDDLPFAIFGLGDTAYEKFCWPAKRLSRRMASLGATELCERGEGDEQHQLGIDGALIPWVEKLLNGLIQLFPLPGDIQGDLTHTPPPPRVQIKDVVSPTLNDDPLRDDERYYQARLKVNKRITAESWFQDVRHFEFEFDKDIDYAPGDVAVIHPIVTDSEVDAFLKTLNWGDSADEAFRIQHTMLDQTLPDHLPVVSTLRTLFSRHLDFNAVPRRTFFQYLRYFTTDDLEKEKLDEFLSPEGADELYEYCHRVKRTIHEVLSEFHHVRIPRDYIFDIFPPLRPREFSIASSVKKNPRELQLCVAIVRFKTKLRIPRKGTCTTYLSALRPGDSLKIGLHKGLIRLPPNISTPIICVGPGTGIAPMRSVIEERMHSGAFSNTLYFGCRSSSKDEHYASEWTAYAQSKRIVYRVACSRDGPEGVKRVYVQDLIREDAEKVWRLVGEQGAWLFISGSSNQMPAGVRDAVAYAVETHGNRSPEEAKKFVDDMVRDGRLIEECWS